MRTTVVVFALSSVLSACALPGAAHMQFAAASKRPFEISDFYRCATVSGPALSPDGKLVVFSVKRYELEAGKTWSEIWLMNADGTSQRQMTSSKTNDSEPAFSPDGKRISFVSTREGGSQVWTMPVDGGEPKKLTDWPLGLSSPVWSPDGKYLAATSEIFPELGLDAAAQKKNADGIDEGKLKVHVADDLYYRHWTSWSDGKRQHILLVDAANGKVVKDLTPGDFESPIFSLGGRGFAFSPDSKELCYASNHDEHEALSTNADLWVVPIEGEITVETARNLTVANHGADSAPLYSADGRYIAYVSQEQAGYESDLKRLAVFDRETKATRYLTDRQHFDFMVEDMRWAADGKSIVFQVEHQGRNPLYRIPLAGGEPKEELRHAFIAGWEPTKSGDGVVYTRRSISEPTEIFRASFGGATPTRLTTFNAAVEAEVDIRPAEELWLDGDGGQKVHCFVVKPHGFDPEKKYPLVLNVHGGPQSQWADAFRGDWQVYPGKGYVVAFCNPTGSTGYGQALTDGITGDWGGRVYRDLMKVTDQLEKLPYVDRERMGVMGWSYGGYMTMWMQGHTTRFKCIASMMGVYDPAAEYGATEELWFPEHDFKGTPWDSPEYDRWSPAKHVKNFRTPALVVSGELDYRVPYTQSLAYYTALRRMNVPARLVILPNAGHWPAWHEMAFYYNVHLDFFHRYLGGGSAPYDVTQHARNLGFEKRAAEKSGP